MAALQEDKHILFTFDSHTVKIVRTQSSYLLLYNNMQSEFLNSIQDVVQKLQLCLNSAKRVSIQIPGFPTQEFGTDIFQSLQKEGKVNLPFYVQFT